MGGKEFSPKIFDTFQFDSIYVVLAVKFLVSADRQVLWLSRLIFSSRLLPTIFDNGSRHRSCRQRSLRIFFFIEPQSHNINVPSSYRPLRIRIHLSPLATQAIATLAFTGICEARRQALSVRVSTSCAVEGGVETRNRIQKE